MTVNLPPSHAGAAPPHDPTKPLEPELSLGELLSRLSTDFAELVSTHIELAKTELKEEARRAAKGTGMFGGAGVSAFLAVLLLSFAAAWGLAEVMAPGWAFLIVGVVWTIVAVILAMRGRRDMRGLRAVPETKSSLKEDVEWAKQQKS